MFCYTQVNKTFFRRNIFNQFLRYLHNDPLKVLYPLESRKLLKIHGKDAPVFLQGLITNDMHHFEEGAKSMYAMFLNNKGRVLYDTLIHKWDDDGDSFLIECDKEVLSMLQRHLKLYKLKRIVQIEDVNQQFKVWALKTAEETVDTNVNPKNSINIYKDPRLSDLGFRVLSAANMEGAQIAENISNNIVVDSDETGYKYLRYKLGVSEGADDLPPGTSFPLEVNCDYLHGVSFHKGCYIGQEVTARVHHTGVVRKRIMPLKFNIQPKEPIEKDTVITASNKPKSNLGKLKGIVNEYGLGLIRIKEALDAKVLNIKEHKAEVLKPTWWPREAPKELLNKNE